MESEKIGSQQPMQRQWFDSQTSKPQKMERLYLSKTPAWMTKKERLPASLTCPQVDLF
jgi:hypothetical protein